MKFILTLLMSVVIGIVSFLGATYTVDTFINQAKHEVRDIVASWKPTKIERELIVGDTQRFLGGFPYNLSGGGVSSSATSFTLSTFTLPQNDYPIQDSDLSDTFYITFEPGNKDRQEIASCTTVGSNSGGTVTISGCTRGLSPVTPYTASTTLQFPHSGGSRIVFSNPPQLYDQAAFKENDETITGLWEFDADNPPKLDATGTTATSSDQLVSKEYVDNVTAQGAATSSETVAGIIEQATAIETASTTQFDANNPHTINSEQATSTPTHGCDGTSTVGALCVAVAENDGKLSQLWIDLTEDFTWTGHHIFSSLFATNASTTNATTTNLAATGNVDFTSASSVTGVSSISTSLIAGETLTVSGDPLPVTIDDGSSAYGETMVEGTSKTSNCDAIRDSSDQCMQSFFMPDGYTHLKSVTVNVDDTGTSNAYDFQADIFAVDGSVEPTGSTLGTSGLVVMDSVGDEDITFTFATPVSLTAGTEYALVIKAVNIGTLDGSNFHDISRGGSSAYSGVMKKSDDSGSTWGSAQAGDGDMTFTGGFVGSGAGRVVRADETSVDRDDGVIGFVSTTASDGASVSVQTSGQLGGFTGLTAGVPYYLSSLGTISNATTTLTDRVGFATSTTGILIQPNLKQ